MRMQLVKIQKDGGQLHVGADPGFILFIGGGGHLPYAVAIYGLFFFLGGGGGQRHMISVHKKEKWCPLGSPGKAAGALEKPLGGRCSDTFPLPPPPPPP